MKRKPKTKVRTPSVEALGKTLRMHRKGQDMTQRTVSKISGVNRQTIVKVESGQMDVTINTIEKIAAAVNCSIDIFVRAE